LALPATFPNSHPGFPHGALGFRSTPQGNLGSKVRGPTTLQTVGLVIFATSTWVLKSTSDSWPCDLYKKRLDSKVRGPTTLQTVGLVIFTKSTWGATTVQTVGLMTFTKSTWVSESPLTTIVRQASSKIP